MDINTHFAHRTISILKMLQCDGPGRDHHVLGGYEVLLFAQSLSTFLLRHPSSDYYFINSVTRIILQLHLSLGHAVLTLRLGLRHKSHLVRIRKTSCYWPEIQFGSHRTWPEMFKPGWNMSWGHLNWTHLHPLQVPTWKSVHNHVMWMWYDTFCRNKVHRPLTHVKVKKSVFCRHVSSWGLGYTLLHNIINK